MLLQTLGFTHVRIPITNWLLFDPTQSSPLITSYLSLIDAQIAKVLGAGLAAIIGVSSHSHVFIDRQCLIICL